ncbi:serine hydrolase [Rasiella rasia]|uniref:Serine hydrolase n=1 Tax=Rasiella rasia TaxID=2744027 RepID=A0A6G6GME3_9FLAO|nr:serine hydrolase [Rasiella rasia]QIE59756.1 serine hydrolase [Rasiella rasia]
MRIITILVVFVLSANVFGQLNFSEENRKTHSLFTTMDANITKGDYEEITSVLIAKDGKLIYEKYYNGATQESMHNTRSATKTIATFLTGIAIDKGFINSEKDKIFEHLQLERPMLNPDPRKDAITLEDLLTMSSIVECSDDDQFSRGNENRMYNVEDWTQFFIDLPVRGYPYSPKPEDSPYGRSMSYCSAGSALIAEVVQDAIKSPADKFMKEHLLTPLNITEYKLDYTPKGTLNTAGGSNYKSRDLLKFIQLCLQKGTWNEQQVVSKSWIEKATSPKVSAWEDMNYGYLFWLKSFGKDTLISSYAMAGNGGNKIVAFPELNVTVVLTTTNYNNRKAHGYTDALLNEFIVPAVMQLK